MRCLLLPKIRKYPVVALTIAFLALLIASAYTFEWERSLWATAIVVFTSTFLAALITSLMSGEKHDED